MDKVALRTRYIARRAALSKEEVEDKSLAIANQALKLPIWDSEYYHIFLSIRGKKEINTEYLLHILQGKDKSICIPVMKSNRELKHILLQDNTRINIAKFGVPEPENGIEVPTEKIQVVFVPLLAYDKQGNRTGYGKGYYDRFLSQTNPNTLFIGLSFFEPEAEIPNEAHDVPLDYCITPTGVHSF